MLFIAKICNSQNYIAYHKTINKAELKVVESDFKKSLEYYQIAFNSVNKPFNKDLYNASLCAVKSGNDSIANMLIRQMILKGTRLKYFKNKSFKRFRKSKFWKQLKQDENRLLEIANQNINKKLFSQLKNLDESDQAIRKRRFGYPMSDTIRKVDSINMIKLIRIFDEFGYPDENVLGVKNPKYYYSPQMIVLRHFYQGQSIEQAKENILGDFIFKELERGKICPLIYSNWEDKRFSRIHKKNKYGTVAVVYSNKKYYKNELSNIPELDKNREKIGIGTYNDYVLKTIFQENQDEFYFGIYEGIHRF